MAAGTLVEVVMPQMGVSVSEGTVSRWLKAEGDTIERDETILEISTDKVDTEVPSPASGVVVELLAAEGDTLDVGAKLAVIDTGGGSSAVGSDAPAAAAPAAKDEPAAQAPAPEPAPAPPAPAPAQMELPSQSAPAAQPSSPATDGGSSGGAFVSPVVARIAAEHRVDVAQVPGSGSGGRVTKKDILAFINGGGGAAAQPASAPAAAMPPAATPAPAAPPAAPARPAPTTQPAPFTGDERVVPFNAMRKAIAKHMIESRRTSAHVTSTVEVDMTRVVRMRGQIKSEYQNSWGVKVTFTHFVIRALIDAISHYPLINAEIQGESAVIKSYVNLGVAVALDNGEGLIVPVIRNAEEKNLVGIARAVNDLAGRARAKQLVPDEVSGGTFTLTNPGVFESIHGTPIINQPQVAILDTEAIVKRPMVITGVDGEDTIAIRSMMNLCISYDHRLIDGAYAVQFLRHIKHNLQEWDLSRY